MNYCRLLIMLTVLSFAKQSSAQDQPTLSLDSFAGKFIVAIRTHQQQHTSIVTDKSIFLPGESIWFTIFNCNTVSNKISFQTPYIFVDLADEKDSVYKWLILDAANQQLSGRMTIPASLPSGNYWIRAYTRQTIEDEPNNIAINPIVIGDRTSNHHYTTAKTNSATGSGLLTRFYPEGGALITGINCTVGIQTTDKSGHPVSIAGTIKDNLGTAVAPFSTNADGLGKFQFEPSHLRKYSAVIVKDGVENSFLLPAFNLFAAQLAVSRRAGGLTLRVLLEDSLLKKDKDTYILGICRDSLVFASVGKGLYEVSVENKRLPEGITSFYLFNKNFNLLSERSVYMNDNNLHIAASTDKSRYGKRENVALSIALTDGNNQPLLAVLAVSVTDSIAATMAGTPGYITAGNDVTGNEKWMPVDAQRTEEASDLLMLVKDNTYPWLSKTVTPAARKNSDSLFYIRGTVLNANKKDPSTQSMVTLLSNSGASIFYTDSTDTRGRFLFPVRRYADSTLFAVEVRDGNGFSKNKQIIPDSFTLPHLHTPAGLKTYLPLQTQDIKKYLSVYTETNNGDQKNMLSPVTVKAKKKTSYDETKRVSSTSTVITSEQLVQKNSVRSAVLSIPGLHIYNGFLTMYGPNDMSGQGGRNEPIVFMDGIRISTLDAESGDASPVLGFLNTLNIREIDFIEVLKGGDAAAYGVRGGNGVILVNTVSRIKEADPEAGGRAVFYARGITPVALFPHPDFHPKNATAAAIPDNRSTLYWNGSLQYDGVNNKPLQFYTGDMATVYRVTITGITSRGDIVYKTTSFSVR